MALKSKTKALNKGKAAKVPSKRTMNFVHHVSSFNAKRMVPVILVIALATGAFVKFGILDLTSQKIAALDELTQKQEQLSGLNRALAGYDQIAYDYGRYSFGWMSADEVSLISRMDILMLIEEMVAPDCGIEDIAISGNVLTMNIHGLTLQQASDMVMRLETSDLVDSASVYDVVAENAAEASVLLSVIMSKPAEEAK